MIVFAMMSCGLPDFARLALLMALRMAGKSWPSGSVCTSQLMALKRSAVFSLCVFAAMASRVTSLES